MSDYILSLSYGKDSLGCLPAIKKLGLPLNRIIHADIWATDTIHADFPLMVEFKAKADAYIKKTFGIEVEHVHAKNVDGVTKDKVTYEDVFYHVMQKGKHIGSIKGFPMSIGQWCQKLKLNAIAEAVGDDDIQYLGIAADEPKRIASHIGKNNIILPLVLAGMDERSCLEWCKDNDLLSPIYETAARGGCWFCHFQGVDQLRLLRKNHPDYWQLLLKWDNDSPVTFHSDGHTVHDFESRFTLEDEGWITDSGKWRWSYINGEPIQMQLNI